MKKLFRKQATTLAALALGALVVTGGLLIGDGISPDLGTDPIETEEGCDPQGLPDPLPTGGLFED